MQTFISRKAFKIKLNLASTMCVVGQKCIKQFSLLECVHLLLHLNCIFTSFPLEISYKFIMPHFVHTLSHMDTGSSGRRTERLCQALANNSQFRTGKASLTDAFPLARGLIYLEPADLAFRRLAVCGVPSAKRVYVHGKCRL